MVNWSHWHTEPLLIGGILVTGWIYSLLIGPLRTLMTKTQSFPLSEAAYFTLGLVTFYLAVGSPLNALGEDFLFSAHMLQHNLLMYLSPLFIVLGIPDWLVDTPARRNRYFRACFRFLVNPLFAGIFFTLSFSVWHFPQLFEATLRSKPVHTLAQLMILISSIFMWWSIASRSKRFPPLHYGVQILFFFALMVAQTPVFAFLTLARDLLYPTYADAARIIPSLDPVSDQILGGIIMKSTNMVAALVVISIAFYKWIKTSEDDINQNRNSQHKNKE